MFELWVPITIAAAFFQNVRSALQKHLKGRMGTSGATMTRFIYAIPFAALYAYSLHAFGGFDWPTPNERFLAYMMTGGLAQIGATALLVYLFSFQNFAVGTTFSKTETVQAAIFGLVVLGDPLGLGASIAIFISLIGVVFLSVAREKTMTLRTILTSWTGKPALIGLASGACFGISAVSYRAASLSLGGDGFLMQAAFTLACVTVFQTVVMTIYLIIRDPDELFRVIKSWRVSMWVGLSGMVASAGWFTAMTIQNAAYVRALGQVELLFTFAVSLIFFKERTNAKEIIGILLVCSGILILLLYV